MRDFFSSWSKRHFSDPAVIELLLVLGVGFAIVLLAGAMLAPVFAAIVIAYILEALVGWLTKRGCSRLWAAILISGLAFGLVPLILFGLLPVLVGQLKALVQNAPEMLSHGRQSLLGLQAEYAEFISVEQLDAMVGSVTVQIAQWGQTVVSNPLATLVNLMTVLVYLVLVPFLVFFFLKDKQVITAWIARQLPVQRSLVVNVWQEMERQMGNYLRGKFVEIVVVGGVTALIFSILGLQYALLLGVLTGLSVIIPYVGAVVVTLPVAMVGFSQWGWSGEFGYVILAYAIIQAIDGNVLVPLLFSEAVNLHPVAIIVAVLFFGGLWGIWGVFFAIPLATLVKTVLNAWPGSGDERIEESTDEQSATVSA
ncbi:MAG: AI-2E family transporter [Gammaproteobacteria bacterium]|nr:MAG: AI-2E family transporter [Gammaproteobacteria bacterium]RLA15012.1 MAG: AI-2E family transporter [Gammaproteobacteria bacterium]RLA18231.1 MAG: AI-2E family transporter [Gammaproteobacteria bacterium]